MNRKLESIFAAATVALGLAATPAAAYTTSDEGFMNRADYGVTPSSRQRDAVLSRLADATVVLHVSEPSIVHVPSGSKHHYPNRKPAANVFRP